MKLFKRSKTKTTNFFDFKAAIKKKIINKAVRESTNEQVKILKNSGYTFDI